MKIFQPMLFVGLGGTGGLIGAELENRLRAELCGPDGTDLTRLNGYAPHQLPGCLQFVYADYSETDLQRLPRFTVDAALRPAYASTSRATHDLLPNFDSSPEVTRTLRAGLRDEVAGWLPPREGEPRITPLRNGAGQLPTVGRAALFATLRHGLNPILQPLLDAIDTIARSTGDLGELGGGHTTGCDVFVAFSVAGGTGAGIFLDYLHLIDHAFRLRHFEGVKIYPLVMMPSAFAGTNGDGREMELNGARALVDLFRLVDSQNAPTENAELGDSEHGAGDALRYPGATTIRMGTGALPTAFLFSPTAGIRADDLRRSIVSLVMSLIGTELGADAPGGRETTGTDDHQTFAANFINRGVHRALPSATGIGRQGVSTSLVASMTVPVEPLADLVAGRLLSQAVGELSDRQRAVPVDEAREMIRQLFVDSHIEDLWHRRPEDLPEPDPVPRGARAVEQALRERQEDMERALHNLRASLDREVPSMVHGFAPGPAVEKLLGKVDPFQAERVLRGDPGSANAIVRLGFLGMLENRAAEPPAPPDITTQPPTIPRLRGAMAGMAPVRWGDDDVQATLRAQDEWYRWRARVLWHRAWWEQRRRWSRAEGAVVDVRGLTRALLERAEGERGTAARKSRELYEDRTGVSYLLPPQRNLAHFYEDVVKRLARQEGVEEHEGEGVLLLAMVDGNAWRDAHAAARRDPNAAVAKVKRMVESRLTRLFVESGEHREERPLLPSMATLLSAAAGDAESDGKVTREALELFSRKLSGLLPVGFVPEGTGPLRVLVTYPRVRSRGRVEDHLGKVLRLPAGGTVTYQGVDSESITVVLFRSEMGLLQVPEARTLLRRWARARKEEQPQDLLAWRQRLGHRDHWLVSSEEDRRVILHNLLCCMWNGQVEVVDGDPASPRRVRLRLHPGRAPDAPSVTLRPGEFSGGVSSWADLLRTYERWTVVDHERTVEDYCRTLMEVRPAALSGGTAEPDPLFLDLVEKIAPRQVELLERYRRESGERTERWIAPLWEFWTRTLPDALDTPFGREGAIQPTLRTLLDHVRGESLSGPLAEPFRAPVAPDDDEDDWGTAPRTGGFPGRAEPHPGDRDRPHGNGFGDFPGDSPAAGADRWDSPVGFSSGSPSGSPSGDDHRAPGTGGDR
ncbi:tubulin-like doman-containing protein [Streptomyces sp. ST2-7A]|uniref:tubulin-like doman-containing protein n=1 Tax=Streptomyces sp. ST2-7A TaxID=2907214 RepID=UPI001F22D64E|nr:tubulin-like doman-containing protein [Streptomyces sp. ST2-7A]MCE7082177.1 tubulin-like doman-containing protein [Streptomyces sp. ST2-7A]